MAKIKEHTLQVKLEQLTEDELRHLAGKAVGFLRENPRVAWKLNEYKEAARLRVKQIVQRELDKQQAI